MFGLKGLAVAGIIILGLSGTTAFLFSQNQSKAKEIGQLEEQLEAKDRLLMEKEADLALAMERIVDISIEIGQMTERAERYAERMSEMEMEHAQSVRRLQDTVDTTRDAVRRDPEKASRVIDILLFRSMRDGCRSSGADISTCDPRLREPATPDTGAAGEHVTDDISGHATEDGSRAAN